MSAIRTLALIAILALTCLVVADQHPNAVKGFNANGVYQFNGLDNVSMFNGNLTLSIPIGQPYSIGGGLTYRLMLYANGNLWEGEDRIDLEDETNNDCSKPPHTVPEPCMQAYPDRRANAGIGWTLSLGRLFPLDEQTNESPWWIYESPDGSEHHLFPTLMDGLPGDPDVFYTRDGTYLRMKVAGNRRTIEFPSGERHTFMPADGAPASCCEQGDLLRPWIVETIGNQFSPNVLTASYSQNGTAGTCTLSDGFRTHTIHYQLLPFESGIEDIFASPDPPPVNERWLVKFVDVAAFGGTVARYTFNYEQVSQKRPVWHNIPTDYASATATVQSLASLELPDDTAIAFEYQNTYSDASGLPLKMTLPTGGRIEWEWGSYFFPSWTSGQESLQGPTGVSKRHVYDRGGALVGTWIYTNALDDIAPGGTSPRELKTTVQDPLQNKTEHYFDVSPMDPNSVKYGLPFTPKVADATGTRYLSQRFVPAGQTTARSTYVRYERDPGVVHFGNDRANSRQVSSRTAYDDDGGAYIDSDSSDYDGLGHYRTVTTSGTGVPTRTMTTSYPSYGTYPGAFVAPPTTGPWLLETYSARTTTEAGKTVKSEYVFENSFLTRSRAIKSTTGVRGADDVITVLTPDARGNVASEKHYGGDGQPVGTGDLVSLTLPTPQYRLDHEYSHGSLQRSQYVTSGGAGMGFYVVDSDIDPNTGLVEESRDASGVPTNFIYDSMGRLTWTKPQSRAWMQYVYPDLQTSFEIRADQFQPPASGTDPGPRIGRSRYLIDGIGRVTTEFVEMPGGLESRRETVYNALGWQTEVSELGQGLTLPRTLFTHDAFGRVKTTTLPDQSVTTFGYTGIRMKTRTSLIATPSSPTTSVTTTEQYDLYGRLLSVTEKSGPTSATAPVGGNVVTEYGYDWANRLTSVTMRAPNGVIQNRLFDYDGRGFLRWESHPESAMTSYAYDSRGHVTSKDQSAAQTMFDLRYFYDAAERLTRVEGRNPNYAPGDPENPAFQVMKEFEFGTANGTVIKDEEEFDDLRKGKLTRAVRHNYLDLGLTTDYIVDDTYQYLDAAGRRTDRITTFSGFGQPKIVSTAVEYNELDLARKIFYPMCTGCGFPPVQDRSNMVYSYDHGRLKTISGFVTDVTYWPNGMRNVLVHQNEIADTQVVGTIPRPSSISFGTYDRCVRPNIEQHPASVSLPAGGGSATLSVTVSGTGPLEYRWYRVASGGQPTDAGTTQSITITETTSASYYVWVLGPCGDAESHVAKVSVGECPLPTTGLIQPVLQVDGSWILTPEPTAGQGQSYEWRRLSDNALMGTDMTLAVQPLSVTTTFRLTVTDSCGSGTSDVTIQVPLQISNGLTATWNGAAIVVTWPAVSGAALYQLQRRSGTAWEIVTNQSGTSYTDESVVGSRTYAYRVALATGGGTIVGNFSNSDVATTGTFIEAVQNQTVTAALADEMLLAVNSVRAALGWPAVSWGNILAPSDPLPDPGTIVLARHVASCRARMDEALHALGVPVQTYVDPELKGVPMKARHINDIQQRSR